MNSLDHIPSVLKGESGIPGRNRNCHGRNADHLTFDVIIIIAKKKKNLIISSAICIQVPVGTIFKNPDGSIIAELVKDGAVFIAARGGSGGKGNNYFKTDVNQAPEVAEYGADGEEFCYLVEMRTIAHVGLVCMSLLTHFILRISFRFLDR